jgi:hypothetical protein
VTGGAAKDEDLALLRDGRGNASTPLVRALDIIDGASS